ncbi:MAG: hypothetical protein HWD57_17035 [Candidatus Accumulibacter cognatus]|uniref:DUF4145 domain-containing protein n=1 Tax=Candidatus Accumulibacter cognatus TaxID=2954383 RepID=A0A7D5SG98_9PROT|nr:MAG: hypothetical protein HWD57_17035 [Candidatus Accumulibacter cognatus]
MYEGRPSGGVEFYRLLFESPEFCAELGQVTLASGQLEAELIRLLKRKSPTKAAEGQPLGKLIQLAEKHQALDSNVISCLNELCKQRNYLAHNIYSLFIELIEETRLERSNLLDSDVHTYIERAWQLKENLIHLAEVVRDA